MWEKIILLRQIVNKYYKDYFNIIILQKITRTTYKQDIILRICFRIKKSLKSFLLFKYDFKKRKELTKKLKIYLMIKLVKKKKKTRAVAILHEFDHHIYYPLVK